MCIGLVPLLVHHGPVFFVVFLQHFVDMKHHLGAQKALAAFHRFVSFLVQVGGSLGWYAESGGRGYPSCRCGIFSSYMRTTTLAEME